MEDLLRHLSAYEPLSAADYAQACGITPQGANNRIRLARYLGLIHVSAWLPTGAKGLGKRVQHYGIGNLPDAPQPEARTNLENAIAYQARVRADKKKYKKLLAKRRVRMKKHRENDSIVAANLRQYQRVWQREKFGYKPRPLQWTLKKHYVADPLLAALLGVRK